MLLYERNNFLRSLFKEEVAPDLTGEGQDRVYLYRLDKLGLVYLGESGEAIRVYGRSSEYVVELDIGRLYPSNLADVSDALNRSEQVGMGELDPSNLQDVADALNRGEER